MTPTPLNHYEPFRPVPIYPRFRSTRGEVHGELGKLMQNINTIIVNAPGPATKKAQESYPTLSTETESTDTSENLADTNKLMRLAMEKSRAAGTPYTVAQLMRMAKDDMPGLERLAKTGTLNGAGPKPKPNAINGSVAERMAAMLEELERPQMDEDRVREIAVEVYEGTVTKQIELTVTSPAASVVIQGAHAQMPELIYMISKGEYPYMYGKPGSGKTTAAAQAAKALSLRFGYISMNPQTPPSALLGFVGADGKTYKTTPFRDIYENGGLFFADEVDNSNPTTWTALNGPIENGFCQFGDGALVNMHPDFRFLCAGNTAGRGGNIMHAGRQALDAATIERICYIEWRYDLDLEERLTMTANPTHGKTWLHWVRQVRDYVEKNDIKLVVSPRASMKGANFLNDAPLTTEQIADAVLFKGIAEDTKRTLLKNVPMPAIHRVITK